MIRFSKQNFRFRHVCWLLLGAFANSCLTSNALQYEAMSETNQYHLARVQKGMSQSQVLQIMHKPYSYESFEVDDEIYDVWFYVTRPTGLDQTRMVPQNLTPLTFKNGVLVGTGYNWYYYAMKGEADEVSSQTPKVEKPKTQSQEDKEFEESLKSGTQKKTPAQKEKLPPNVHIISKSEINYVPEEREGPSQIPCGPERFAHVSNGMSESQIFSIFGEPMKHETFEICSDSYDVWFYDTIPSKSGKPSRIPQQQTVLTFKNSVLISKDDETFFDLKRQVAAETREPKEWPSIHKPYEHKGAPLGVTSTKAISGVKKGMSEAEVMKALGVTADQDTFMIGDDVYNIWFYEVGAKEKKSIPLTFKNGVLVGTTEKEYNQVKNQVGKECKDCYDKKGEGMQQDASEQNFNYW